MGGKNLLTIGGWVGKISASLLPFSTVEVAGMSLAAVRVPDSKSRRSELRERTEIYEEADAGDNSG